MTKRIVCLILSVIMIVGLVCIDASAAISDSKEYFAEDLTKPDGAASGWTPDAWAINARYGLSPDLVTARYVDDGYIELARGGNVPNPADPILPTFAGAAAKWTGAAISTLPNDFSLLFDVKIVGSIGSHMLLDFAAGSRRKEIGFDQVLAGATSGQWYTVCIRVRGTTFDYFYKPVSGGNFVLSAADVNASWTRDEKYLDFYAGTSDATMYIDNIRAFAGTYLEDKTVVVSPTEISATVKIASEATLPTDTTATVIPVLAAFDKKGKIVAMDTGSGSFPLSFGFSDVATNKNVISLAFGGVDQAFYDSIKGGTVELYLCDALYEPLAMATVINVE